MEKSVNSFRLSGDHYHLEEGSTSFKCSGCGEKFRNPLLATVSSNISVQKYYACPRCLTKVDIVEKQKSEESRESVYQTREAKRVTVKLEESVNCNHFIGYLKKRPKDSPFPEECLTCSKMIECLTH
jgi:DNA-directed RNA polymerase subunit RPC12/RpoP